MLQAVTAQQKAVKASSYAASLREKASKLTNSKEREKLVKEAYDAEIAAHGHSKFAQRLQSGSWQGLAAGSGIGLGTGLGVGTVVGTLVGGLVSIPTTGLGALIGTGVGAVNGPFIKLGGKEKKFEDAKPEEVVDAIQQEQLSAAPPKPEQSTTTPPTDAKQPVSDPAPKKKPRKLEVRSQKSPASDASVTPTDAAPVSDQPRKPKKLQTRSKSSVESVQKSRSSSTVQKENEPPEGAAEGQQ